MNPKIVDAASTVKQLLANAEMRFFGNGMERLYTGEVHEPTFSNVIFQAVPSSGSLAFIPSAEDELFTVDYTFAAILVYRGTGQFVRSDGFPVENSNLFTIY